MPVGFLFLNEPFLQLGGEPALLSPAEIRGIYGILMDF